MCVLTLVVVCDKSCFIHVFVCAQVTFKTIVFWSCHLWCLIIYVCCYNSCVCVVQYLFCMCVVFCSPKKMQCLLPLVMHFLWKSPHFGKKEKYRSIIKTWTGQLLKLKVLWDLSLVMPCQILAALEFWCGFHFEVRWLCFADYFIWNSGSVWSLVCDLDNLSMDVVHCCRGSVAISPGFYLQTADF